MFLFRDMNSAKQYFDFFTKLTLKNKLPNSIEVLNPYKDKEVIRINKQFFEKYYSSEKTRIILLGINPGRFGAGITGISFTDPVVLETNLKINNNLQKKTELSATFIHSVINEYGGPQLFFDDFLLSAVCPLGFIKNGVNINYYDDKELLKAVLPFIKESLQIQARITGDNILCGCIGQGKNMKFLLELNKEMKLFKKIIPLPHPRWVMQYKRKELSSQVSNYIRLLNSIKRNT